jgi:hypothetical protein
MHLLETEDEDEQRLAFSHFQHDSIDLRCRGRKGDMSVYHIGMNRKSFCTLACPTDMPHTHKYA